jgi:hypothetical protein
MAGRRKPKWVSVDCVCGHGTVLELQRKHDLAAKLKCSKCGRRGPKLQWIASPPRVLPEWLRRWKARRGRG